MQSGLDACVGGALPVSLGLDQQAPYLYQIVRAWRNAGAHRGGGGRAAMMNGIVRGYRERFRGLTRSFHLG